MKFFLSAIILIILVSCSPKKYIICTNESSCYLEGTYISIENCNDCKKIEKRLTLKDDYSYELRVEYIGSDKPNIEKYNGSFSIDKLTKTLNLYQINGEDWIKSIYNLKDSNFLSDNDDDIVYRKLFSNDLTDEKWYMSFIKDIRVGESNGLETNNPYIKFENSGIVNGKTSCNRFSGHFYGNADGSMSITGLIMTSKSCEEPEVRRKYIDFLTQEFRYDIVSDTLYFRDMNDEIIAKFVR